MKTNMGLHLRKKVLENKKNIGVDVHVYLVKLRGKYRIFTNVILPVKRQGRISEDNLQENLRLFRF